MAGQQDSSSSRSKTELEKLLHEVELLLKCPSLPEEAKQMLRSHELIASAKQLLNAEVAK